jgi:hypothetical protein
MASTSPARSPVLMASMFPAFAQSSAHAEMKSFSTSSSTSISRVAGFPANFINAADGSTASISLARAQRNATVPAARKLLMVFATNCLSFFRCMEKRMRSALLTSESGISPHVCHLLTHNPRTVSEMEQAPPSRDLISLRRYRLTFDPSGHVRFARHPISIAESFQGRQKSRMLRQLGDGVCLRTQGSRRAANRRRHARLTAVALPRGLP